MNITLPNTFEKFVQQKVASGDFQSVDEVVSEGLRLLQQQDKQWVGSAQAKIEVGWLQAKSGRLRKPEAVRENLAARKAAWRAKQSAK